MNLQKLNTIHYITNILKQKSMKKKEYERPTMQVVQLKQQSQLLAGSVGASRDGYGDVIEVTWGDSSAPLLNDDVLFE